MQQTISKMIQNNRYPLNTLAALLAAVLLFGCSTTEPGSASFASVQIANKTQAEIAAATAQVFGANGYSGGMTGSGQMVFEKEASRGTSIAREGLVAGYYGTTTINRVRVEIAPLAGGTHRLQCKAFMVTGGTDTFFQDEVPVTNVRSRPYQNMLNDVAKNLK